MIITHETARKLCKVFEQLFDSEVDVSIYSDRVGYAYTVAEETRTALLHFYELLLSRKELPKQEI